MRYSYDKYQSCARRHFSLERVHERCYKVAVELKLAPPHLSPFESSAPDSPCLDQQARISNIFSSYTYDYDILNEDIRDPRDPPVLKAEEIRDRLLQALPERCYEESRIRYVGTRRKSAAKLCKIAGIRAIHTMYDCLAQEGKRIDAT